MERHDESSAEWKTTCTCKVLWEGKVIKYSRATAERNSYEEGFIYWDDMAKKPAFFFIHSGGAFSSGFVSSDRNVITFKGKMTWPAPAPNPGVKQSYDIKNTFEFVSATEMVDRWFQDAFGPWRPGHVVNFKASALSTGK
jgi:hypothetical protein